jgi:hypothetical protein
VGFLYLVRELHLFPRGRTDWKAVGRTTEPRHEGRLWKGGPGEVREATFYDIHSGKAYENDDQVTQEVIDTILDKISKGGYQSLTEEEKRILNEASKKIH